MSKNQVNYLLALATLVVVWLYFNTLFSGAVAYRKTGGFTGRMPAGIMEGSNPSFIPRSYRSRDSQKAMPSLDELRKMVEARRTAAAGVAAATDAKAPVPAVPEKK